MKAIFLILGLLVALPLAAKEASGRIVDTSGEAISYVNVGIRGTTTGTISGRDGAFLLDIPDSLASRALSFSHVSYISRELPSGVDMRVELQAADYAIDEVVVRPGKARHKRLSGTGFQFGSNSLGVRSDSSSAHPTSDLGAELGTLVEVKYDFAIEHVHFAVKKCSDTTWVLRFNIYAVEDGKFTNLIREPLYFRFPLIRREHLVQAALPHQLVLTPGTYFVALEFVELGEDLSLLFPLYIRSSYIRHSSMGEWEKCPVNIGLVVEGVEYR